MYREVCKHDLGIFENKHNVREQWWRNQEWTIRRHRQHWVHKTQDEDEQKRHNTDGNQGLTNPLARRSGLAISTFGLAEIISCSLYARRASKKKYRIFIINKLVNIRVSTYLYIHIYYMLFNQQQCFIYSTAGFSSKLRAKKVEKLGNSS